MFERISAGWELTKQSYRVLKLDKELVLFPILSGLACLVAAATFAVPLFLSGAFQHIAEKESTTGSKILSFLVGFAFYFANYFVIVFFNSALVACAIIRLKGGNPTVGDGLSAAFMRVPQIASWALVAATVGLILKAIESRRNRFGEIVAGILGMAWSVSTFFVAPILVVENLGPFAAISRSVSIVKQAWGESLTANFSVQMITTLVALLGAIPIVLGGIALSGSAVAVGIPLIVLGIVWLLAVSVVSSALHTIVIAALYIYAAEKRVPDQFDSHLIQQAFVHK